MANPFTRWRKRRALLQEDRVEDEAARFWETTMRAVSWSKEAVEAHEKRARELREEAKRL